MIKKDYTTITCKGCGCDINVWKYTLTSTKGHSGNCRACGMKAGANTRTEIDRDAVYLKKQLRNIKARCCGKYPQYASYIRKGISVCDEWLNSPSLFITWAKSNGWAYGLTIDRIDNSGNYCPSNCRWIENVDNVLLKENERLSRGASKYVGIWFRKDTNKWAVEVKVDTKKVSLGCFHTEDEAMLVRENFINDKGLIHLKRNT